MDIVEQLRATPETGADPDMIFEAADEIDRLRQYIDAMHCKGEVRHCYNGMCPDKTQPDSRDDECPACLLLTPNAKSQATDAVLSRQVACTDGFGLIGPERTKS